MLILSLLMAPLLLLVAPPANAVGTLCLPSPTSACIAGTLRTESGLLPGIEVTVTNAKTGEKQTATTGPDGKWNVTVKQEGPYDVSINESELPKDVVTKGKTTATAKFGVTAPALIELRTSSYNASVSKVDELVQSSANGLRLGLLLALASIGLSLIYGTTGLSNFAHAEQVTLGGILGYWFVNLGGLSLLLGGLLVVAVCAFTGWFQDRVMWQPLRRRGLGLTQLMIVTIGLSLAMQYTFQFFVGARTVRVVADNPDGPHHRLDHHDDPVAGRDGDLDRGARRRRARAAAHPLGRATRAVSDNPALAAASGIDVDKVIRLVWTVAMGLAGLSGSSTRWSPTASSGTPACRSCCCSSPR